MPGRDSRAGRGRLEPQMARESAAQCGGPASTSERVRGPLKLHHLTAAFVISINPDGEQFSFGLQQRYDQGCVVVIDMRPRRRTRG